MAGWRHVAIEVVMWAIALNIIAVLWVWGFHGNESMLWPVWIFFFLEAVLAFMFVCALPLIWSGLVKMFTIGAGVAIGNSISERRGFSHRMLNVRSSDAPQIDMEFQPRDTRASHRRGAFMETRQ